MRAGILFCLFLTGCTIRNRLVNNFTGYILRKTIGISVVPEVMHISWGRIELENATISYPGGKLAEVKKGSIVFNRETIFESIKLEEGEIYLKLDLDRNYINWAEPFTREKDYEEFKSKIPNLGDISFQNMHIFFNDKTDGADFNRDVNNANGLITFDSLKQIVSINTDAVDRESEYLAEVNVEVGEDTNVEVNLDFKYMEVTDDAAHYTRAQDFLSFYGGNIDLTLNINQGKVKGKVLARDVKSSFKQLKNTLFNFNGEVFINSEEDVDLRGAASYKDTNINLDLNVNIPNKKLSLVASSDDFDLSLIKRLTFLETFNPRIGGDANVFANFNVDLQSFESAIKLSIKSENGSAFGEKLISSKLDISLVKDTLKYMILEGAFDKEQYIDVNLQNSSNLNLKLKADFNTKALEFINLSLPNFRAKVNTSIDINESQNELRGSGVFDSDYLKIGDKNLNFNIRRKDKAFTLDFYNSFAKAIFFIDDTNFLISFDTRTKTPIYWGEFSFKLNSNIKIAARYKNKFSFVNSQFEISFYDMNLAGLNISDFTIRSKLENNTAYLAPFDISFNSGSQLIKFDQLTGNIIIDSEFSVASFNLSSFETLIEIFNSKNEAGKSSINLLLSRDSIIIKKIVNDVFSLSGVVPFNTSSPNLNMFIEEVKIMPSTYLDDVDITYIDNNLSINGGILSLLDIALPISGSSSFKNKLLDIYVVNIGSSSLTGTISNELDLKLNVSGNDIFNTIFKDIPFDFIASGEVFFFGNISDPSGIGTILITSDYVDSSFDLSYSKGKVAISDIYFWNSNDLIKAKVNSSYLDIFNNNINMNLSINEKKNTIFVFESDIFIDTLVKGDIDNLDYSVIGNIDSISYENFSLDGASIIINGDLNTILLNGIEISNNSTSLIIKGEYSIFDSLYSLKVFGDSFFIGDLPLQYFGLNSFSAISDIELYLKDNKWTGSLTANDIKIDMSLYNTLNLDSSLILKSGLLKVNLLDTKFIATFDSEMNRGDVNIEGEYDIDSKSFKTKTTLKDVNTYLKGSLNLITSGEVRFDDYKVIGDIRIKSGYITDLPSIALSQSQSENPIKIDRLNVDIDNGVKVRVSSFAILDSIELDIEGKLAISDLFVEGFISSNKGSVTFNKNKFDVLSMSLLFNKESYIPYLNITAQTFSLEQSIIFNMSGSLDTDKIIFRQYDEKIDSDSSLGFSLYSAELSQEEIIYLLSLGTSDAGQLISTGSSQITSQLAQTLILNPISKNIKEALGFYEFRIYGPSFDLNNENISTLDNFKLEASTNIYKNFLFLGITLAVADEWNKLDSVDIRLFTLNRWTLYFSFSPTFDNILFEGLGISKRFGLGRQSFEFRIGGIESLFAPSVLRNFSDLEYILEFNMRF